MKHIFNKLAKDADSLNSLLGPQYSQNDITIAKFGLANKLSDKVKRLFEFILYVVRVGKQFELEDDDFACCFTDIELANYHANAIKLNEMIVFNCGNLDE